MSELFVADMDGTLMDSTPAVSMFTRRALADLQEQGMVFTVATARSAATVSRLLDGVPLSLPAILMNGACIWDKVNETYLKTEPYPIDLIIPVLRAYGITGFSYAVRDDRLLTCYERIASEAARLFMRDRELRYGKVFMQVDDLASCGDIVYFSTTGRTAELAPAYRALCDIDGIRVEFYDDVYHLGNSFLEVAASKASKAHALRFLRTTYGFDHVTAFGDNLNDLSLFEEADMCLAVGNARPELKEAADEVIGSNTENGVARYLLGCFELDRDGSAD